MTDLYAVCTHGLSSSDLISTKALAPRWWTSFTQGEDGSIVWMNVLCDWSAFTRILNCTAERCTSIILTADLKLCCKDLKCTLHRIYLWSICIALNYIQRGHWVFLEVLHNHYHSTQSSDDLLKPWIVCPRLSEGNQIMVPSWSHLKPIECYWMTSELLKCYKHPADQIRD